MPGELPDLDKSSFVFVATPSFQNKPGRKQEERSPHSPPFCAALAAGQGLEHVGWSRSAETTFGVCLS